MFWDQGRASRPQTIRRSAASCYKAPMLDTEQAYHEKNKQKIIGIIRHGLQSIEYQGAMQGGNIEKGLSFLWIKFQTLGIFRFQNPLICETISINKSKQNTREIYITLQLIFPIKLELSQIISNIEYVTQMPRKCEDMRRKQGRCAVMIFMY